MRHNMDVESIIHCSQVDRREGDCGALWRTQLPHQALQPIELKTSHTSNPLTIILLTATKSFVAHGVPSTPTHTLTED
jgi:hypothetical protein